jgi:sensor c-di-GMP phosphodiesterase-like protein
MAVTIAEEVRAALDRGELFVEYLPTLTLLDGCCVGGEALVRWRRHRSVLAASAFVPLIENTPISGTITYWVIDTVAAQLGEWLGSHQDAHISINVPPEILGRGGLEYAAVRSGLRARIGQIVLEITERGIPDRLGLDALTLMAERGVRLALDDTMLSGANLALLTRCPFSMIKLDRELISQLQTDKEPPEWLRGLESLLKTCSLQVVAEGVETDYQSQRLHAIGVQMAQGHLYSAPLTARGLMDFYADNRGAVKPS